MRQELNLLQSAKFKHDKIQSICKQQKVETGIKGVGNIVGKKKKTLVTSSAFSLFFHKIFKNPLPPGWKVRNSAIKGTESRPFNPLLLSFTF